MFSSMHPSIFFFFIQIPLDLLVSIAPCSPRGGGRKSRIDIMLNKNDGRADVPKNEKLLRSNACSSVCHSRRIYT